MVGTHGTDLERSSELGGKYDILNGLRVLVRSCENGGAAPLLPAEALSALCLCDELGSHLQAMARGEAHTPQRAATGGIREDLLSALKANMPRVNEMFKQLDQVCVGRPSCGSPRASE